MSAEPGDEYAVPYYWPLIRNTLFALAAAEFLGVFASLIFPLLWSPDYADFGVSIVFFGCLLIAAQCTIADYQGRYGFTNEHFGFSKEDWIGNALLGIVVALAMQSLRDIAVRAYHIAVSGQLGSGPVFTWFDTLLHAGRVLGFGDATKALNAFLVPAIVEEIYFRGVFYTVVNEREGTGWAVVWSSLAFSAVHQSILLSPFLGWQLSWSAFIIRAVIGIVFCWLRVKTRTLVASSSAHCLWNIFVILQQAERG